MPDETMHYTTERRMRYLNEIGLAAQIGAVVDELRALRDQLGAGYTGSPSFSNLVQRIDAIKSEVPKS